MVLAVVHGELLKEAVDVVVGVVENLFNDEEVVLEILLACL